MDTPHRINDLKIIEAWLLEQRALSDTSRISKLEQHLCKPTETINRLLQDVQREMAQQSPDDPVSLVGRSVRIVHCAASHHSIDNYSCICHLKGRIARIDRELSGLYNIDEVVRMVRRDEFEMAYPLSIKLETPRLACFAQ